MNSPKDVYKKIKPVETRKSPQPVKNMDGKRMSQVQINFPQRNKFQDDDSPPRPQLIKQVNQSDLQTASNSNMDDVLNKSRVTNGPNEKWAFKSKDNQLGAIPKNLVHKKEFSMTGNFQGSPKVDS